MTTKLTCTAPCSPPCTREATFTLINARSRVPLGVNCDEHIKPLMRARDPDYDKEPLPGVVAETPAEEPIAETPAEEPPAETQGDAQ